jgi:D-tagatose-1,6-bisphosphate aldolase subunit GatZ/KbaZ
VIGTEVPVPGGAREADEAPAVTAPDAARRTIEIAGKAFRARGLQSAWERVIAVVVQPGVEFGDDAIFDYRPDQAGSLSAVAKEHDGLVFEAHSTDYQREKSLQELVEDHFAILKVGPALTFAFREAVFCLEMIEQEWLAGTTPFEPSNLRGSLEKAMMEDPGNWKRYYHGDAHEQRRARAFSFSDRVRYYWPRPSVQAALARLIANLSGRPIPLALLSQFMPRQYESVRAGTLLNSPRALVSHRINEVTSAYARACGRR